MCWLVQKMSLGRRADMASLDFRLDQPVQQYRLRTCCSPAAGSVQQRTPRSYRRTVLLGCDRCHEIQLDKECMRWSLQENNIPHCKYCMECWDQNHRHTFRLHTKYTQVTQHRNSSRPHSPCTLSQRRCLDQPCQLHISYSWSGQQPHTVPHHTGCKASKDRCHHRLDQLRM